ncbi:hypothetical protein CRYUN_Cryun27aG0007200 [Craigia yunnanensis]
MKGDYHRYLTEFKTGDDRKAAAENTFTVYRSTQLYGNDYIEAYKNKSIESQHVYAIADTAIREMTRVFKGRLKDGSLVAIKRAKKDNYDQGLPLQFKNEILTLSKIEHLNLVRLFGFLEHRDEQIIVVEYVGNGNLQEHLDGVRGNGLEIANRLDIAIDVSHAVTYLHTYTGNPPIIHRDIKALNILVTEKLSAKVANFGFARLATEDPAATHISTQVKGTAGYLDPDYTKTYQLTDKSDVYSFGVLLVELMTGRYPIESSRPVKERVTIRWFSGNGIHLVGVCPMYLSKDTSGVLSPFKFSRRETGEKDVAFKVLYCGICHSDLHMVKNEWGSSIYPLVPGKEGSRRKLHLRDERDSRDG